MLTSQRSQVFNISELRAQFPILQGKRDGLPLVYLDNAATAQKPEAVISAMSEFMASSYGTVRRGVYNLSEKATAAYEDVRGRVARLLNARIPQEIVFTKGCTEAINLVARSYGGANLKPGDEVILSAMEHHANIVPWQLVCAERGAKIKVIPIDGNGELMLDEFAGLITERTKIVAVCHVSNVLGTVNPISQIVEIAKRAGVPVLVDGAQAVPHQAVDVQALGCDFYCFSGHKFYGPTGIGVLFGKYELLRAMPPFQGGGDMIEIVSFEESTFAAPPHRFEAGTPPIAQVIGLGAAIDYVQNIGFKAIERYETELLECAENALKEIDGLHIVGSPKVRAGLISFTIEDVHPHDIGTICDSEFNLALRAGHHCAQPLLRELGLSATTRVSFGLYNTFQEVDVLLSALSYTIKLFRN